MGRPIKKKFFGNPSTGGVGGESVATIALNNTGTLYTTSTTLNLTFTAPQVAGGVAATGQVTTNAIGNVNSVTLLTPGFGYTAIPTATVAGGTSGVTATFIVTLTTTNQNALNVTAYLPTGTQALVSDIVKQEASVRYLVRNTEGVGACKLVASNTPAAGQMFLVATDVNGSTYWVTKLTARRAHLTQRTMNGSYAFATGSRAGWTLGTASAGRVSLASI